MALRKIAASLTLVALLAGGTACSSKTKTSAKATTTVASSSTDTSADTGSSTDTSSDTSNDTSNDTGSDTSSDTGSGGVGGSALTAKLLVASDLPAGWELKSSSDDTGGSDTGSDNSGFTCDGKKLDNLDTKLAHEASADFAPTGKTFPSLTENIASDSESKAKDVFSKFTDTFGSCSTISMDDTGNSMSGTLAEFPLQSYGDDSGAFLMSLTTQGVKIKFAFVLVRKGSLLVNIVYGGLTAPTKSEVEGVVGPAIDKL